MGLTKVTTKLTSFAAPECSYEAIFLVDTGATDSMAPADELEKTGLVKEGRMVYELADWTVKESPYGLVRIEFRGKLRRAVSPSVNRDRNHCWALLHWNRSASGSIPYIKRCSGCQQYR